MAWEGARRRGLFKLLLALAGPDHVAPTTPVLGLGETLALAVELPGRRRTTALLDRLVELSCLDRDTAEEARAALRGEGRG